MEVERPIVAHEVFICPDEAEQNPFHSFIGFLTYRQKDLIYRQKDLTSPH